MLPGWSRGYVLAHLARGADAMRNLLVGASTGEDRPGYASSESRAADIEHGSRRSAKDLAADVADAAMALRTISRQLPDPAWRVQLRVLGLDPFPAGQLLTRRPVEVPAMERPEPMRTQRQDRLDWAPEAGTTA